jgi:hypothetical protein
LFNGSLQRACSRPQEEDIMIRRPESPAATSIVGRRYLLSLTTEGHKSADTDSNLAPSTEVVDPNSIITSVDLRAQIRAEVVAEVLADLVSVMEAILAERRPESPAATTIGMCYLPLLSLETECHKLADSHHLLKWWIPIQLLHRLTPAHRSSTV